MTENASSESNGRKRRSKRRKTSHLKNVPETKLVREQLRARCYEVADSLDKSRPLSKDEMEQLTRKILADAGQRAQQRAGRASGGSAARRRRKCIDAGTHKVLIEDDQMKSRSHAST